MVSLLRLVLAAACAACAVPALAAELPVEGSFRDAASCEAVQRLATDTANLSASDRTLLGDAVQGGVTMEAERVSGPGGWSCSFPQVWPVRADRWMAMAACEADDDFFPAVLTLERRDEETYRLRLGDSADAVDLVPCTLPGPEAADAGEPEPAPSN